MLVSSYDSWLVLLSLPIVVLGCYGAQRMRARTTFLATSLANAHRELAHLALHDNLTRLPNRVLLETRMNQAIHNAISDGGSFSLMFIDLDGFKTVNDAFGHHIGDLLLVEAAHRIQENIRDSDTLFRVGGDEFVVLTNVGEPADVTAMADKLVAVMGLPFEITGLELSVSVSIGIANYPIDGEHQHDLLVNADAAMYYAKEKGRDRYCFFENSMNANAHGQLQLLHDLRLAVERNELILYYQPKFNAPNGSAIGAEALVRWNHPVHGMISPDQFIPLAEKSGLILSLGEWVLNEACRQMKLWQILGGHNWTIAVNLSSLQFVHAGLIQTVRDTLKRNDLDPRYLVLEITESTAMHDVESSMVILQQLHEMGVSISIDDFGTGYSSLLYLKRLPASELKIDRGFISELAHNTEDEAIVSAIVALGQTLKLNIVAEGVETTEQQDFLTRIGCNSLQGFLLGHPMPADRFMEAVWPNEDFLQTA